MPSWLSSGAGEFEDDGHRDAPDDDEHEVIRGHGEQTAYGVDGFFFHGGSPV